ncbi:OmpA family protein [Vicingus serpentipes]|uniref:OmpA family protein n=1 Tax=Vicingus serpentipes TaxID=1926625 RepID=A0A5C6RUK6_9FLAO|nr:OmpA family protein [Vicingus serpentipes]TXB65933.1 OmpA family protein [Vicingus serpentipes]
MKQILITLLFNYILLCSLTAQETVLVNEEFNDNSFGWYENNGENIKCEVKNGTYLIKNKTESSRWIYQGLSDLAPDTENFTIEIKLKQSSGEKGYGFGILFSMYGDNSSYQKFLITSNKDYKLDHFYSEKSHIMVDYKKTEAINEGYNYNVLKVVKTANIVAYFINDELVYKTGKFSYYGSRIAFFLGNKMEMEIDYLKVTKTPRNINLVKGANNIGDKIKLSNKINTDEYDELVPIISADGKTLYCVRADTPENVGDPKDDQDIWYSTLEENGEWSTLKNFGKPLNNTGNNFLVSASPDNNSLIVANTYKPDGSKNTSGLSISNKTVDGWEVPKAFVIEDNYNDNNYVAYFLCSDNKTLILSVERKEGAGEKDLYVSFIKDDNTWSKPKNLGLTVNTFEDETNPFVAADNKTLYFSSKGHYGYGSYDVFVSKRLDDTWTNWSKPQNLGSKVNSPSSELGYFLDASGEYAYLSSGGDICKIENSEKPEAVVLISGITYNKKTAKPMTAKIKYYDLEANVELGIANSDPVTGEYKIILPAGKKYSFVAQQDNFYPISENLDLKQLIAYAEQTKDLFLLPIEKGEVIRLNNIFFEFNEAKLKSESFNELDRLFDILVQNNELKIEISGHTDDKGSDEYNRSLSKSRANSVMDYLTSKGIDKVRLSAVGYGESNPVVANDNDDNRAINRRVEFKVM